MRLAIPIPGKIVFVCIDQTTFYYINYKKKPHTHTYNVPGLYF